SKKLGALKSDSARLLYTWLIPWLDIEGRYTADPDILKGHLFPKVESMAKGKINKLLFELAEIGLIYLYKSNGEQYLQFTKFKAMQTLHKEREAESKIPAPNKKSCELMINHDLSPQVKLNSIEDKSNINEVNILIVSKDDIFNKWNEFAKRKSLAEIKSIKKGSTRERHLLTRIGDDDFDFDTLLLAIEKQPFLLGQNKNGWKITFDWILLPSNYPKVMEGNYLSQKYKQFMGLKDWYEKVQNG
ncbi:hypothetical protein CMI37_30860, partial [Candidatus Pacearchaeota archaeon]|nr:hypothetical protein [Candidatus Pacearchaeota archaeon]